MRIKACVILAVLLSLGIILSSCSSETESARIGQPAPDFKLENLEGEEISLSDFQGDVVLINFWYTGCTACHGLLPYLQEIDEEGKDKSPSVVVLTINPGESRTSVKDFLEDNQLSITVLFDDSYVVHQKYHVTHTPTTIFIDPEGIIHDGLIGAFPSKESIEMRLADMVPGLY